MLPLLVNRTLVAIQRDQLLLVQYNRLTKQVTFKSKVALPEVDENEQASTMVAKLEALLETTKGVKALSIVVSSDFVRYLTLAPVDNVMRATDRAAFAKAAFYEVYGAAVEQWQIQCDNAPPGQPTLCAAIDQSLLAALAQCCRNKGVKLSSIQPYLMSAYNRIKSQLLQNSLYFSVVESGRLLVSRLHQGQWQHVRNLPLESDWVTQLAKQLEREQMFDDVRNKPTILIYAPYDKTASFNKLSGWQVSRVGINSKSSLTLPYGMLEVAL